MKDNLPNIWHNHDGKGMPVFLHGEKIEVRFSSGCVEMYNNKGYWDWNRPRRAGKSLDIVAWRYIQPEQFESKGPITAEELEEVMHVAMTIPKSEIQHYPEDNRLTKYQKHIRGRDQNGNVASVVVDVYDVLTAWEVQNPALQHLIKKALQPGERGHKSLVEDLKDIIASAQRALEIEQSKEVLK